VNGRCLGVLLAAAACGGAPPAATRTSPAAAADSRLAPGDHLVRLDGQPLAYHVAGSGPPCVVWPGGPGVDSAYLRSPLERDLTLVYVDPVGTGASARLVDPTGYTRARYVGDLEKLRAALGLAKMCLIGHSFGGFVALLYTIAHPDRVSRLVLYDTAARLDEDLRRAAAANLEKLRGKPWHAGVVAGFAAEGGVGSDEDATRAIAQISPAYLADWDGRGAEIAPLLARSRAYAAPMTAVDRTPYDVRDKLPALAVPTLVVVGRHDFICSPPFAEEIARAVPGAKLVVFENSGHFAHLEEPEAFRATVAGFVR
jgi:proline iminopeptidase